MLSLPTPRRGLAAVTLAVTASTSFLAAAPPAGATTDLLCSAHMSTSSPRQYSTDYVLVTTARSAAVRTSARYKTTTTVHTATANSSGRATVAYRISRATKGFRVLVSVTVRRGTAVGNCATAFVPR
ncbi:MAG TPA: hypothetical protein VGN18_13700 [Jatrophihabitans sp.]|jgi:hypothetical protein|uniref:hypothetical protein n=1 Tax=Jatrophihabitans sp. TaxID=1932789 RepID=UPI002E064FE1|nr:hypothetical protein [Jatrophihabitans sp.]